MITKREQGRAIPSKQIQIWNTLSNSLLHTAQDILKLSKLIVNLSFLVGFSYQIQGNAKVLMTTLVITLVLKVFLDVFFVEVLKVSSGLFDGSDARMIGQWTVV